LLLNVDSTAAVLKPGIESDDDFSADPVGFWNWHTEPAQQVQPSAKTVNHPSQEKQPVAENQSATPDRKSDSKLT